MSEAFVFPQWPAPARVRALMTTRTTSGESLRAALPSEPLWLRQVHGTRVVLLEKSSSIRSEGDASVTRESRIVCAVQVADCMPVLLADEAGAVVGAAHAGWRGLCGGVIEATLDAMRVPGERVIAWLGPAIGPQVYEVGDEVREAFVRRDPDAALAFTPRRPGHWLLDLYRVARQRLMRRGVERIFGGGFCTYSEPDRFHSYRRERGSGRQAGMIWLD